MILVNVSLPCSVKTLFLKSGSRALRRAVASHSRSFYSAAWWERHWGRTGILDIEVADTLPEGWWRFWVDWLRLVASDNATEIGRWTPTPARNLGYVRVVGRRRADTPPYDPVVSVPMWYEKKPLLRGSA